MTNGTVPPYQPEQAQKEYQSERAHADYQASNETGRAASQAAILINGGAATAILAFLSKQMPPPLGVVRGVSVSLVLYAAGVACGAFSMFSSAHSSADFAYKWQTQFFSNERQGTLTSADRTKDEETESPWLSRHRVSTWLSFIFFLLASLCIAIVFMMYGIRERVP